MRTAKEVIENILENDIIAKKDLELFIESIIVHEKHENIRIEIKLKQKFDELLTEYDNLLSTRRRLNREQYNIVFINAMTYLAEMYKISQIKKN